MAWMIKVTKYRNCHSVIEIYNTVTFTVNFLVVEKTFEEILSYDLKDNDKSTNTDLF